MSKTDKESENRLNEFTDKEKIDYLIKNLKPVKEDRLQLLYYEGYTLVSLNCIASLYIRTRIWNRLFGNSKKRPAKICSMGDDIYADIDYVIECLTGIEERTAETSLKSEDTQTLLNRFMMMLSCENLCTKKRDMIPVLYFRDRAYIECRFLENRLHEIKNETAIKALKGKIPNGNFTADSVCILNDETYLEIGYVSKVLSEILIPKENTK